MDEVENPEVSAPGQTIPRLSENEIPTQDRPVPEGIANLVANSPAAKEAEPSLEDSAATLLDIGEQKARFPRSNAISTQAGTFKPPLPKDRVALPTRPPLKRDASAPRPLALNTNAVPESQDSPQDPPDSLTLADLRRIREGFPIAQHTSKEIPDLRTVYDFEYADAQSFAAEIEEWFSYSTTEAQRIISTADMYIRWWGAGNKARGEDAAATWRDSDSRELFIEHLLEVLSACSSGEDKNAENLTQALLCLCYLALGVFHETAGQVDENPCIGLYTKLESSVKSGARDTSGLQIKTMIENAVMMIHGGALECLLRVLEHVSTRDLDASAKANADVPETPRTVEEEDISNEIWTCLTVVHVLYEVVRLGGDTEAATSIKQRTARIAPDYLHLLTKIIGKLRWDEAAPIPISKVFTLHWKSVLLAFGGVKEVLTAKAQFKDAVEEKDIRGAPVITASPLDYHLFRQEISSKYPAYQPPKPAFPFEPENNSILPPLRHRQSKYDSNAAQPGPAAATLPSGSIMHQPVHIATPAPSPPPSPAGAGGKGGKKQNYQTNQMFPFLYPPLDQSSNDLGGKGSTELQDALVGRKWHGTDVPTSILEAAELFARRMRATRAMKQLWRARVDFMKYDRGWKDDQNKRQSRWRPPDDLPDDLKIELGDEIDGQDQDSLDGVGKSRAGADDTAETGDDSTDEDQAEEPLPLPKVAEFYQRSLPFLQSYIIVSLKAVLKHVTDLVAHQGGRAGAPNGLQDVNVIQPNGEGPNSGSENILSASDEVDSMRTQEITNKALTGGILLLLKWFKLSHILRYEYLTQLLLDSNYIPLVLKLWQTQDISRAVHFKLDRPDANFFALCGTLGPTTRRKSHQSSASLSSLDSAAPPPIQFHRRTSSAVSLSHHYLSTSSSPTSNNPHPPEIDELGYPQTALPSSPITSFSRRNVLSLTNHLRILQKVTRRKAHRSLLLVSYKSSNHLRKSLRVPIEVLRYYTLKLFKSQVPYCGRKWRQSNMKIITAVWLSVPAELRDDWLIGGGGGMGGQGPGDVDGTVEEALPLEQSLRALTYWWNCKVYPVEMGKKGVGGLDDGEDKGFFERELERMGVWEGSEEGEEGQQGDDWEGQY